jgi:hypothetical protein
MCCHVGASTLPPCREEGLGGKASQQVYSLSRVSSPWRLSLCCDWVCQSSVGLGWWAASVVLSLCSGGPNGQEQCGVGGQLLAFGCLGSRTAEMHRVVRWSCRQVSPSWAASCPELRRDPVGLQASESILGSLLSREAQRHPAGLQASEFVLGSWLSGNVWWGCRRLSLFWAAGCLEKHRGLPLLLLVMGRWSMVLCRTLQKIPLFCWLRCTEYVSGEVSFVLSVVLLVGVTNIWKYCRVVWSDNYCTNIYIVFINVLSCTISKCCG